MANRSAATGDVAKAQSYFSQTGLTEQQCALIGLTPALRRTGASPDDYPMEALRMGFEGWVNVQFDIQADGKPASARAVIAYPPLIFVPAAQRMAGDVRYTASYRPGGSAACSGNSERFVFALRKP
jgi:outer membrane biosynthesis protein TonB